MGNGQDAGGSNPSGWGSQPSETAQRLFDALVAEQVRLPGVTLRPALRKQNLAVHGKVYAFLQDGRLVVKLPATRVAVLVEAGEASLLRSGNRTMREWITVDPPASGDADSWRQLVEQSRRYVDPTAR